MRQLNKGADWQKIFGKPSVRLKDQELILRFLAFYFEGELYKKPVNEFVENETYQAATSNATSDEVNVNARMREASKAFDELE